MASIEALSGELILLRREGQRLQDQLQAAQDSSNENNIRSTEAAIAQNRAERDQVVEQINNLRSGNNPVTNTSGYSDNPADITIVIDDIDLVDPNIPGQTGGTGISETPAGVVGNGANIGDIVGDGISNVGAGIGDAIEGAGEFIGGIGSTIADGIGYGVDVVTGLFDSEEEETQPEPQKEGQVVTFVEEEDDPLPQPKQDPPVDDPFVGDEFTATLPEPEDPFVDEEIATENALLTQAKQQAAIRENLNINPKDWRFRISCAPGSTYLYNAQDPGILQRLRATEGVVFPYTPEVDIVYNAHYNSYSPTHSNQKSFFYRGSDTGQILVRGRFTAQDTSEAEYLLAVIHFFRSTTKMFYGQDPNRGTPPPLLYLTGFGEYQFNQHPVILTQFNYNLPADVDYIRANNVQLGKLSNNANDLNYRLASRQGTKGTFNLGDIWARLTGANLAQGAEGPGALLHSAPDITDYTQQPTYVPTKIDIALTLEAVQSRQKISQEFSFGEFARGGLVKRGFW